jgi:signal transduction histidine kinase
MQRRPWVKTGRWIHALFLLRSFVCILAAAGPLSAKEPGPTVTNVSQLYRLSEQGQRAICSLRLEGIVCAANPANGGLILGDDSGAAYVEMDFQGQSVQPGQRIVLEGNGMMERTKLTFGKKVPLVDNDGLHEMFERSGMVYLKAGKHPIDLLWFNGSADRGLEVYYSGPDLPRQKIPDSALFHAQADPAGTNTSFVKGLNYSCYEGGTTDGALPPDFSAVPAVKTGTVPNFDINVTSRLNDVALEFTGYIELARDGLYSFSTRSDDGSRLFVGEPQRRLEVIDTVPTPAPHRFIISQFLSGGEQNQWSEVEGLVTFVSEQPDGIELQLSSEAGHMRVKVMDGPVGAPIFLLNNQVRATGVCLGASVAEGQRVAGAMWVASWKQIELLQVAADHWTESPLASIGGLLADQRAWTNGAIVRVQGRLRAEAPGMQLLVEDGTGQISVEGIQAAPESAGVQVELLGKVNRRGAQAVLQGGFYREMVQSSGTNAQTLPLLTSAKQIQYLSRAEASRGYPVRVRGVVISTVGWHQSFVMQDLTHGIFVRGIPEGADNARQLGDFYEVEGVTDPGDFAPIIVAKRVTYLGVGRMPDPIRPNRDQFINGSLDGQYVELQGVVTAVEPNSVTLLTLAGKYRVDLADVLSGDLRRFENALIRIKGCCYAVWDNQTKQITIGEIRVRNASINVDEPAPADLFSAPVKSAAELLLFDAKASALKRVKVSGQIVHERDGEYFMMNGTNGLRFFPKENVQLRTGDRLEVVGFPELGAASPILREAIVRKTGESPLPEAHRLTAETLLRGELDATLVQIESQLVGWRTNATEQVLELQSGPRTYLARLGTNAGSAQSMPLGSRLRLTGVYAGQGGDQAERREIDSFELLLNSLADVAILQRPSWWTPQRTLTAVGALLAVLLLAAAWIAGLRRRVEQRTKELRIEIEKHKRTETQLAGEIEERKRMEVEVERTHRQLVDASRQAGQAEVASSVLHNVGNVLNSVNVSAGLITDRLRGSKAATGISRVAGLLAEHRQNMAGFLAEDGRVDKVTGYLEELAKQMGSEQASILQELHDLARNVDHIKEIVAMQQNYAQVSGITEIQSVAGLVEDALRVVANALARNQVHVVKQLDPIPDIVVDKHKVLQVLVSLITNAVNALSESTVAERVMTLMIKMDGDKNVSVSVADNGMGISPENLKRIFTHGFTTRRDGHGLGLHSGFLTAQEMGGTLRVHSDGPGKGAIFTLEIPSQPKEKDSTATGEAGHPRE